MLAQKRHVGKQSHQSGFWCDVLIWIGLFFALAHESSRNPLVVGRRQIIERKPRFRSALKTVVVADHTSYMQYFLARENEPFSFWGEIFDPYNDGEPEGTWKKFDDSQIKSVWILFTPIYARLPTIMDRRAV